MHCRIYWICYIGSFPLYERMSMEDIFAFASDTDTDVPGIYDNSLPIGFAVILKNEKCGYLYYIAIDKSFRSKGYGGAALKKIIASYPDLQIILDFEEIDVNAEIKKTPYVLQNTARRILYMHYSEQER